MKSLKLTIALICLLGLSANAQITVNVNTEPVKAPVTVVRYYYLPEAEAYYDVQDKIYIYRQDGKWKHWKTLPPGQAKKVSWIKLTNYNGSRPYDNFEKHKVTYVRVKSNGASHKKVKVHKSKK
jgi:hypothetical protein